MSWRVVGKAVLAFAAITAVVLMAPVLWLQVDEGAVPSASDAPALPAGVTVAHEDLQCASGGCWLELRLTASRGRAPAPLLERAGYPHRTCAPDSWLDRRRVCTDLRSGGAGASLVVQYDRSRWF